MRYFTYLAEHSFKTSESGERLFYNSGIWSRPYIIPDDETEKRLYRKQVWLLRILLGGSIIGQPFVFMLRPEVMFEPIWFLAFLVLVLVSFRIVGWIVFARDLKGLKRASSKLSMKSFYGQMAKRHSASALLLGFVGSLLFLAVGVWMASAGENIALAIASGVFGCLCAIAWGYSLYLKLQFDELRSEPDEIQQA